MTSCIARSVAKAFSISLSRSTLFVSRKLAGSRWLLQVEHKKTQKCLAHASTILHVRKEIWCCTCGVKSRPFANSENFNYHETVKEK